MQLQSVFFAGFLHQFVVFLAEILKKCGAEAGNVNYSSISEEEWRKRLSDQQFYVTRQKGTERAFTGYKAF